MDNVNEEEKRQEREHVIVALDRCERTLACLEAKATRFSRELERMLDYLTWDDSAEENTFKPRPELEFDWHERWPSKEALVSLIEDTRKTQSEIHQLQIQKSRM